jgi:hypothetical protein
MKLASAMAALIWSTTALAQVNVAQEPDRVVHRAKSTVDFSGVVQEGQRTGPAGAYGLGKGKAQFANMIKVRQNFAPELRNSKDDL